VFDLGFVRFRSGGLGFESVFCFVFLYWSKLLGGIFCLWFDLGGFVFEKGVLMWLLVVGGWGRVDNLRSG